MSIHQELHTLIDYLRYAMSAFQEAGLYYGHGTDNAWDEAVALTLHTLHLPHDINPAILHARLLPHEREKLAHLIHERVHKRIPVPYLTHEAWFAGLSFYIDERVLIPRSPIAELIQKQFEPWLDTPPQQILDLCTGSGCIAIACAKTFPESHIDASDVSSEALTVAKINLLRHQVDQQIHLYESNVFDSLPLKQYDLILSNPPYVSTLEMAEIPAEFRHEPILGLAAGQQGLDLVIKILQNAYPYLHPEGTLIVEVGNSELALAEAFPQVPFTWVEFEHGGGGVFVLSAKDLKKFQGVF